jgi:hypothetical protein
MSLSSSEAQPDTETTQYMKFKKKINTMYVYRFHVHVPPNPILLELHEQTLF